MNPLSALQRHIAYTFSDTALLAQALTHRSAGQPNLERMEFLGDAVLSLAVSEAVYSLYPDADEGSLTRRRARLVCRETLLTIARTWGLADCITVGKGERRADGGLKSEAVLADAVEAVIGAVFLDGGWTAARAVVRTGWAPHLTDTPLPDQRDAKTRLQELTQGRGWGLPEYTMTDRGPAASPRFEAVCHVQGKSVGVGGGSRKKAAERRAAEEALANLDAEDECRRAAGRCVP